MSSSRSTMEEQPEMSESSRRGEVVTTSVGGSRWLVTLNGEHDLTTAAELRSQFETVFRSATTVVIDLSNATFIDSSTLSALIHADRLAEDGGCEQLGLVVVADSPPDRLLKLAGLQRTFTRFASVEQALAWFESVGRSQATAADAARWGVRKQRIVKNEQQFRDYNNRRMQAEPVDPTDDDELIPFVCECGDSDCIEALMITAATFTEAHSAPNLFVVKPGHLYPDVERLVSQGETYAIVEKHGSALNQLS
jgi:anti-sigma B factor antagonist